MFNHSLIQNLLLLFCSLSGESNVKSTKTTVISGNLNPSWTEETYTLQYDFGVENVLTCKLNYSWMVSGDECIGFVNIPLRKLDFKSMLDTYPIEFSSKKAKIKAEQYNQEKRELPSLSLHLEVA
jgi:Ca2+-dependent lipid-binding protein